MAISVGAARDKFLLACDRENKSSKTMRSYRDTLEDFIHTVGDMPADIITAEHLRGYISNLSSRSGRHGSFSPQSIHKYWSVVRTFIRWMYKKHYIYSCISDFIELPQPALDRPGALEEEEVQSLFDYLTEKGDFRNEVIFKTFLATGLRVSELTHLDLDDLDLEAKAMNIEGKNGQDAIIPFSEAVQRDLYRYIRDHRKCSPSEKALFITRYGSRLEPEALNMVIKRTLPKIRESGKCGAETLRNTFANTYLRNGGSIFTLHTILRNADFRTTQRYVDAISNDLQ